MSAGYKSIAEKKLPLLTGRGGVSIVSALQARVNLGTEDDVQDVVNDRADGSAVRCSFEAHRESKLDPRYTHSYTSILPV